MTLPPVDTAAAAELWTRYAAARPTAAQVSPHYTVERFGDSAAMADELLDHVVAGRKRATSSLVAEYLAEGDPLPSIGAHWIACDGAGVPRLVLRTTGLRIGAFHSVDEAFAHDEGEDDRTRDSWIREHRRFWQRRSAVLGREWSEDDEVVFERFDVVFPPELAT
ncbi:ASCH domain-containing protein [Actinoplanes sp. NPDC051859]|uniref:ASCH domain-containing protein n=1 Tax=Actinoplanes sp. NPDC051859 TaxID=3363909 RepID=UPI0037BDB652